MPPIKHESRRARKARARADRSSAVPDCIKRERDLLGQESIRQWQVATAAEGAPNLGPSVNGASIYMPMPPDPYSGQMTTAYDFDSQPDRPSPITISSATSTEPNALRLSNTHLDDRIAFCVKDALSLEAFLRLRLGQLGQLTVRKLMERLLDVLCPKKRRTYPYGANPPPWWPAEISAWNSPHKMNIHELIPLSLRLLRLYWTDEVYYKYNTERLPRYNGTGHGIVENSLRWSDVEHLYEEKRIEKLGKHKGYLQDILTVLGEEYRFRMGLEDGTRQLVFSDLTEGKTTARKKRSLADRDQTHRNAKARLLSSKITASVFGQDESTPASSASMLRSPSMSPDGFVGFVSQQSNAVEDETYVSPSEIVRTPELAQHSQSSTLTEAPDQLCFPSVLGPLDEMPWLGMSRSVAQASGFPPVGERNFNDPSAHGTVAIRCCGAWASTIGWVPAPIDAAPKRIAIHSTDSFPGAHCSCGSCLPMSPPYSPSYAIGSGSSACNLIYTLPNMVDGLQDLANQAALPGICACTNIDTNATDSYILRNLTDSDPHASQPTPAFGTFNDACFWCHQSRQSQYRNRQ